MRRLFARFGNDQTGAVAPIYVLSLVGLIAMAGIGYDFAQMATLDTELQNAADQAALAAATQLGGTSTAIADATSAASTLVSNSSVMAEDGGSNTLAIALLTFYSTKADAEAETNGFTAAAQSASAKYVKVTLAARRAKYTLTPIVGLLMSPSLNAAATAGLGSSICKVPPVMVCNPAEGSDPTFSANYVGKGLRLISVQNSGGNWASGNFGYIDVNGTAGNSLLALKQSLAWISPPGDCLAESGIKTKPGANASVTDALNTRFDMYDSGGPGGSACPSGGSCPPSTNTVKDVVRSSTSNNCTTGPQGWQESTGPYLPSPSTRLPLTTPQAMGHPRDICHSVSSSGDCAGGIVGDGNWDRTTYFAVNYPGFNWQAAMTSAFATTSPTRFQVYRWEVSHSADTYTNSTTHQSTTIGAARVAESTGNGKNAISMMDNKGPVCTTPGINPVTGSTDRRTFPVAVVNCIANGVDGSSSNVPVVKWMNVFLVEPSLNRGRTAASDVYVEGVSVSIVGNGDAGNNQVVRRDKPYLVK